MTTYVTDVVYLDGKKEQFTSKTPPSVIDSILTNSKSPHPVDDLVFGIHMSEIRRFSYKMKDEGKSKKVDAQILDENHPAFVIVSSRSKAIEKASGLHSAMLIMKRYSSRPACKDFIVVARDSREKMLFMNAISGELDRLGSSGSVNKNQASVRSDILNLDVITTNNPEAAMGKNFDVAIFIGF